MNSLSEEQRSAFRHICNGSNILLTGPAGCGKSFLIEKLVHNFQERFGERYQKIIVKTSLTGISASIIGGVTIHSFLGIGLGKESVTVIVNKINSIPRLKKRYFMLKILVIDEVSMLSAELFEKIDDVMRQVRKDSRPFGGVQVILSGDFCQLPVIGTNVKFCFQSPKWDILIQKTIYFQHVYRQSNPLFVRILMKIRMGEIDDEVVNVLSERVGQQIGTEDIKPSTLYSTRTAVNDLNNTELQKLISEENKPVTYKAVYSFSNNPKKLEDISFSGKRELTDKQQLLFKDLLDKSTIADETLTLCVGCQVIVLINHQPTEETGSAHLFVNGSRGVITGFIDKNPVVKFINGTYYTFEPYGWSIETDEFILTKKQIPIKLAWSLTIHKSQGLTLDCVQTDIGNSLFEFGQAYVALSRVRTLEGLSLISFVPSKIKVHPDVFAFYKNLEQEQAPQIQTQEQEQNDTEESGVSSFDRFARPSSK